MTDIDIEQARSAEEPGTLGSLREKHRQARQVLTGHPNDPALATPDETPDELPQGKDVKPPPDEKVEPPSKEEPEAPAIAQPEGKKYKYANQEEAERAQEEAARKMHEATQEAADLKKKLEEMEKTPQQPKEEPPPQKPSEEIEAEVAKTWEEIDNLDPYDDEYYSKRAKLFTRLLNLPASQSATPGTDTEAVRQAAREEFARIQAEEQKKQEEKAQEQASRSTAVAWAKEAGLNMDDEAVDRLFWDALNRAPYHEGVTLKEQVDFMVSEVKRLNADRAREKGAATPDQQVLERGSSTPVQETPTEDEKPRKLSEIKDKWRQQRQI